MTPDPFYSLPIVPSFIFDRPMRLMNLFPIRSHLLTMISFTPLLFFNRKASQINILTLIGLLSHSTMTMTTSDFFKGSSERITE